MKQNRIKNHQCVLHVTGVLLLCESFVSATAKYALGHSAQCSFYSENWSGPVVSEALAILSNLLELCDKRFLGPHP